DGDLVWLSESACVRGQASTSTAPQERAVRHQVERSGSGEGSFTIMRQLTRTGRKPEFGPVKNGTPRTVDLSAETVALLKEHKRHQAEIKMANRSVYHDFDLVFAKEWGHLHGRPDSLGFPIQSNTLGQVEFARLIGCEGAHHHRAWIATHERHVVAEGWCAR